MKWFKVPGYQVDITNHAKYIRNSTTKKIKTQYIDKDGYKFVNLSTDTGKKTKKGSHQLVMLTFKGPCPKGYEVNHKNLIKSDNTLKNLEYVTHKKNINHALNNKGNWAAKGKSHGQFGEDHSGEKGGNHKLTWKKVKKIRKLYATGKYTQRQLAKKFKVDDSTISGIVNFKFWK
jgi:hypothetical protein